MKGYVFLSSELSSRAFLLYLLHILNNRQVLLNIVFDLYVAKVQDNCLTVLYKAPTH